VTLTIENPYALYKFFEGLLTILVFVDIKLLKRKYNEKGINAEVLDKDYFLKLSQ
jgi:hypothetical protein